MPRILLVEDDNDVRVLLEHVLIAERYRVDPAATLAAGRMLLGRNHYHLLLADGVLPDGTGMQLADDARRRGIPVIIMTSYGFRFSQTELAGFDLLLKPVRPAELLQCMDRVLLSAAGSRK